MYCFSDMWKAWHLRPAYEISLAVTEIGLIYVMKR